MKKLFFLYPNFFCGIFTRTKIFCTFACLLCVFALNNAHADFASELDADFEKVQFASWNLIIYRPDDYGEMNTVRCFLKLEDEDGNDVTYTNAKATYEWVSIPDVVNKYQNSYYLSGGMAMHLNIKPGKYRISFYTPKDKQNLVQVSEQKDVWQSNVLEYDTANPTRVIFVYPTRDENTFYNGGWTVDFYAPKWRKYSFPRK